MLTFDEASNRFTYRTVAVFLAEDKVLLHTSEEDEFWSLPGGRVEHGESAKEAIAREMKEELAIDTLRVRPIWAVDNFFTYQEKNCHELGMYFEVAAEPNSYIYDAIEFMSVENETDLQFKWFDLKALGSIELYPSFLTKSLLKLPKGLEYICHRDA